ncbi:MAG: KTSC domain-containing protein [Saprospiraceae bacterium]|nr:KTSC domain-containing protein [Saprospiraceae bacterium]
MKNIQLIFLLFIFLSCKGQNCETLQDNFRSYDEALNKIETTKFNFTDEVNTSKSSWIINARFYSCNKKDGYFILETSKKSYIFDGLPINIWNDFKNAESFGSYYHKFIRGGLDLY